MSRFSSIVGTDEGTTASKPLSSKGELGGGHGGRTKTQRALGGRVVTSIILCGNAVRMVGGTEEGQPRVGGSPKQTQQEYFRRSAGK